MQLRVVMLSLCMLLTGTLNTISTKYQDLAVVGYLPDGSQIHFRHPAVQSACMFFGEMLCLLPYFLNKLRLKAVRRHRRGPNSGKPRSFHVRRILAFAAPALCDAIGTTLLNVGLFYTYASTFQMLRGTLVLFAGCFTIVILRRQLYIQHWLGMICITAGAALVGAASVINAHQGNEKKGDADMLQMAIVDASPTLGETLLAILAHPRMLIQVARTSKGDAAATAPLFGDIMVVLAQMFTALQFILEEKFLSSYQVPPLLAVGLEGAWGMVLCMVALPVLSNVHTRDGLPIDDAIAAFREMASNPSLLGAVLASILSIGFFNFFGVSVTKALSGAARATIDACRTLFVWLVCLALGWEKFLHLQVVGFIVLLAGTSLYNELLKTCLPKPIAELLEDDGPSSSSSSSAGDSPPGDEEAGEGDHFMVLPAAGQELQQPLLATAPNSHHHPRQGSEQPSQQGEQTRTVGLLAAPQPPVPATAPRRSAPKPMRSRHTEEYSMARSMRMGAQMLDPRALDDMDSYPGPSSGLGGSLTSDDPSSCSPASAAFTLNTHTGRSHHARSTGVGGGAGGRRTALEGEDSSSDTAPSRQQ